MVGREKHKRRSLPCGGWTLQLALLILAYEKLCPATGKTENPTVRGKAAQLPVLYLSWFPPIRSWQVSVQGAKRGPTRKVMGGEGYSAPISGDTPTIYPRALR
jgi:hypothetical protein